MRNRNRKKGDWKEGNHQAGPWRRAWEFQLCIERAVRELRSDSGKGMLPGPAALDVFVIVAHQCQRGCQPMSQTLPWKRQDQVGWPQTTSFPCLFFFFKNTPEKLICFHLTVILNSLQQILPLNFKASSALVYNCRLFRQSRGRISSYFHSFI